jgi:hypothetical protein
VSQWLETVPPGFAPVGSATSSPTYASGLHDVFG